MSGLIQVLLLSGDIGSTKRIKLDHIQVKGKNQPVSTYKLLGFRSDPLNEKQEQIIEHYNKARQFYHARKFSKAVSAFAEVLELDNKNKSASLHLSRCQHFLVNPPSEDWDGVWRLIEK